VGSSGPSEYMEVPLGSLELPSEGTLSPNHAGNCQLLGQGATRGHPQGLEGMGRREALPVWGVHARLWGSGAWRER
jgi:hypothetical protein